jgi:hypothetical protein
MSSTQSHVSIQDVWRFKLKKQPVALILETTISSLISFFRFLRAPTFCRVVKGTGGLGGEMVIDSNVLVEEE